MELVAEYMSGRESKGWGMQPQMRDSGDSEPDMGLSVAAQGRSTNVPLVSRPVGAQLIHPVTGQCWSGKGKAPQWVKDLVLQAQKTTEP